MSDRKQKLGLPAGSLIYIGDKDKLKAHVDVTVFDFNENQITEFCPTDLNELIKFKNHDTVTWINIDGIHDVEFIKQAGEIFEAILNWDKFIFDRLRKIEIVWPYSVNWLNKPTDRLPPVIPIALELDEKIIKGLGIASGYRMFERINSFDQRKFERLVPIPIHQDVDESWLYDLMTKLEPHICI